VTLSQPSPSDPARLARLEGWKEIAAYLRKGVRTVQRWEKELGLPVRRRGTGRGEVVFAIPSELDEWHKSAQTEELTARVGEDEAEAPAPERQVAGPPVQRPAEALPAAMWRRPPAIWLSCAALGLGLALLAAYGWSVMHPAQPATARVENGVLRVFDDAGRFLWEHRFDQRLESGPAFDATRRHWPGIAVDDLDGDGRRDVMFITNAEPLGSSSGLYCFDDRGRVRFTYFPHHHVTFGEVLTTGPWHPLMFAVLRDASGKKFIWLASNDTNQFPTVIEKIDATGRVHGQFWHPGLVNEIRPWIYRGRRVVLVAGGNNDFNGASLAVVDEDKPTGTAPAHRAHYVCAGCPTATPLAFIVFPPSDIERLQDSVAGVSQVWASDDGNLTIELNHQAAFPGMERLEGGTHYHLDANLQPLSAEHQPQFHMLHDELFRGHRLDHPFGSADIARLSPIYRWNGRAFDEVRVPSPAR
jgi:hypothetical protein